MTFAMVIPVLGMKKQFPLAIKYVRRIEVSKLIKILFVCHGNVCRSPMAEHVFKDLIKKDGKESNFLFPLLQPMMRFLNNMSILS